MITKELTDRINYLARKQHGIGLSELEKKEQKELREEYLANIRLQVVGALEAAGCKPKGTGHEAACGCPACSSIKN